jgi:hypothetical protein
VSTLPSVAGLSFNHYTPWVAIAVLVLMLTVVTSYRQNVHAYPSGGGDHEVATVNLGPNAGLTVASALLVDYVLTVAVSVCGGRRQRRLGHPVRRRAQGRPVIDYVKSLRTGNPRDIVTLYVPEYVVGRWWEHLLHNQSALRLKGRLLFTPGVMVTSVPWQLRSSQGLADREDGAGPGAARRGGGGGTAARAASGSDG